VAAEPRGAESGEAGSVRSAGRTARPFTRKAVRLIVWPLLSEFLHGSFRLLLRVFIIVVPIMVVLELFEGSRPFRRLVRLWARLMKPLGMTEEIATPTFVGFLFGIAYGSGVIIRETRRRRVPRRQVFLMSAFLSQVHAIVEDSLVFIALGAAALWVIGFRLVWATVVTALLGAVAAVAARRGWGRGDGPDMPVGDGPDAPRDIGSDGHE